MIHDTTRGAKNQVFLMCFYSSLDLSIYQGDFSFLKKCYPKITIFPLSLKNRIDKDFEKVYN